jgi:hypothetical protein
LFGQNIKDVRVNSIWEEYYLWEYFGLNKNDLKKMSNLDRKAKVWFCSCMERKKKQVRTEMEMKRRW